MKFKKGQIVKHKLGREKMIVTNGDDGFNRSPNDMIYCRFWNFQKSEWTEQAFYSEELEVVIEE